MKVFSLLPFPGDYTFETRKRELPPLFLCIKNRGTGTPFESILPCLLRDVNPVFHFSFFCSTRLYYSDPNNVISVLDVLEDQTFFYITAGGDEKASGGQDEVMAIEDLIFERYYAPWMPVRNTGGLLYSRCWYSAIIKTILNMYCGKAPFYNIYLKKNPAYCMTSHENVPGIFQRLAALSSFFISGIP